MSIPTFNPSAPPAAPYITDLNNPTAFPTLRSCPPSSSTHGTSSTYYTPTITPTSTTYLPSRHWCLLAEITDASFDNMRITLKDKTDITFPLVFWKNEFGQSLEDSLKLGINSGSGEVEVEEVEKREMMMD